MQFKGLLLPAPYSVNLISFAKSNLPQFKYWPCKRRGGKASLKSIKILQFFYDLIIGLHNSIRARLPLEPLLWACKYLGIESKGSKHWDVSDAIFCWGTVSAMLLAKRLSSQYIFHQDATVNGDFDVLWQLPLEGSNFSNNCILTRY